LLAVVAVVKTVVEVERVVIALQLHSRCLLRLL
jgi:hypothetical protein